MNVTGAALGYHLGQRLSYLLDHLIGYTPSLTSMPFLAILSRLAMLFLSDSSSLSREARSLSLRARGLRFQGPCARCAYV